MEEFLPINSELGNSLANLVGRPSTQQSKSQDAWNKVLNNLLYNPDLYHLLVHGAPNYHSPSLVRLTPEDMSEIYYLGAIENQYTFGVNLPGACAYLNVNDIRGPYHPSLLTKAPDKGVFRSYSLEKLAHDLANTKEASPLKFSLSARKGIEDKIRELQIWEQYGTDLHYAYIVGHPDQEPNPELSRIFIQASHQVERLFQQRGYRRIESNVKKDQAQKVSKKDIFKELTLARELPHEATFVFTYIGHGSSKGELCLKDNERLHAKELYAHLAQIEAKKIIILNGCYTGKFLDTPIPSRTKVITAASADQVAYGSNLIDALCREMKYGKDLGMMSKTDLQGHVWGSNPQVLSTPRTSGLQTRFLG